VADSRESLPKSASGDGRSVNYPLLTLQAAIGRARQLWDSVGKNLVPIATAGAAWGYGEKSSGLRSTVSALKQYGLLEDIGDGAQRQVKLLERALDILVEPADSPKHRDAVGDALRAPRIYQELFERFPAGVPAQDHAISSFLLRDKAFNRKAVEGFIWGLRANLHFAAEPHPAVQFPEDPGGLPDAGPSPSSIEAPRLERRGLHVNRDVYALGPEGEVVLEWPDRLSQASYDELSDWIELQLRKIARINGVKRQQTRGNR
jgi:hypothetical protein